METHPFRAAVEARDLDGMVEQLAEDVEFHSPVSFRPFVGRGAAGRRPSVVPGHAASSRDRSPEPAGALRVAVAR